MENQEKDNGAAPLHARAGKALSEWVSTQPDGALAPDFTQRLLEGLIIEEGDSPLAWQVIPGTSNEVNLNETYFMVTTWASVCPPVAEALLRGVFSVQQDSGALPSHFSLDDSQADRSAPWPTLAQATLVLAQSLPQSTVVRDLMPSLHTYLAWILQWYAHPSTPIHTFKSVDEAMVPSEFGEDLAQVELSCMLLCELEAWDQLKLLVPDSGLVSHWLNQQYELLTHNLDVLLWRDAEEKYMHRLASTSMMREATCGIAGPLMWEKLPPRQRDILLSKLEHEKLEPLIHAGSTACGVISLALLREEVPLPTPLAQVFNNPTMDTNAMLTWPVWSQAKPYRSDTLKGPLAHLEKHRYAIASLAVILFVVTTLAIAFATGTKKNWNATDYNALKGLADTYAKQGQYEEALALYDKLALRTTELRALEMDVQKGHIFLQQGHPEKARALYEGALDGGYSSAQLLLNLGHALRLLGHPEQAAERYREVMETYPHNLAGLDKKAKEALKMIEKKL